IKDLKLKKKDVLENIEKLDSNLKRGAITAGEYFQEFDQQKALLKKINNRIKELELKSEESIEQHKVEDVEIKAEEQLIELEKEFENDEEKQDISLKEKIKSFLPKGLKFPKIGISSSSSDEEKEILKDFQKKTSIDSVTLREFKFFHEKKIAVNEHPNFIHLTLRNFLEDLGYKIIKIKKPLAEMIEVNREKSRINEYAGYLVGVKNSQLSDSNESLSIFIRNEGICSIYFDGKQLVTETKTQISMAGNSNNNDDEELEKDINTVFEKMDSFS
ncbi:MAG: hypothetical protein ACFFCM_13885, partial [Promethearchaeota archaeon]